MSVYVGIDVHRKRSQVAVVTEDGKVQLNRNAVEFLKVLAGQALIGTLTGQAGPVQQESTATGGDLTGRAGTSWDGDLRRRTAVDVLPVDGMQEVRGSNPLSSTQVRQVNSKSRASSSRAWYSSKIQQRRSTMALSAAGIWLRRRARLLVWPVEAAPQDGLGAP
jgi:hypothetical protein